MFILSVGLGTFIHAIGSASSLVMKDRLARPFFWDCMLSSVSCVGDMEFSTWLSLLSSLSLCCWVSAVGSVDVPDASLSSLSLKSL